MKNLLAVSTLFGTLALLMPHCHAQNPPILTKVQRKDVADLIEKIKAKLPAGWSVSYRAKGSETDFGGFEPKKAGEVLKGTYFFDLIDIDRAGTVKMVASGSRNRGWNDEPYEDGEFGMTLEVTSFFSTKEYEKTVANNQKIQKQLRVMQDDMVGIDRWSKTSGYYSSDYRPKTAEEMALVKTYRELEWQIVKLPELYFQNIGLNYWGSQYSFYRIMDKSVRRECALVTQQVDALLTRYNGEKFKIDEEAMKAYLK